MRYGPAETLVSLMVELAGSRTGLTLADIMDRFEVGRRTAERLLAACRRMVEVEELPPLADRRKRWRVTRLPGVLADPNPDELAALRSAAERFREDGLADHADRLQILSSMIAALLDGARHARLETDLEALLEAEGFASRPGPRPHIDPEIFAALRHAVLAFRKVRIHYRYRQTGEEARMVVHPYGFLYGSRHYLIAFSEAERSRDVRQFALPNILSVEEVAESFEPVQGFSMNGYTRDMFGVFREPPSDVVWRFSALAARDARAFRFHPDQRLTELPDGRLEVAFQAGGLREMAWHLFRWGGHVEIVAPEELRSMLVEMLRESLSRHAP